MAQLSAIEKLKEVVLQHLDDAKTNFSNEVEAYIVRVKDGLQRHDELENTQTDLVRAIRFLSQPVPDAPDVSNTSQNEGGECSPIQMLKGEINQLNEQMKCLQRNMADINKKIQNQPIQPVSDRYFESPDKAQTACNAVNRDAAVQTDPEMTGLTSQDTSNFEQEVAGSTKMPTDDNTLSPKKKTGVINTQRKTREIYSKLPPRIKTIISGIEYFCNSQRFVIIALLLVSNIFLLCLFYLMPCPVPNCSRPCPVPKWAGSNFWIW